MSLGYRLSDADKRVIKAFTSGKAAESRNLRSTGNQLHGLWMGGAKLGVWRNDQVFLNAPAGNISQTIYNFAKKSTPSKVFGGYMSEIHRNPSSAWKVEHKYAHGWDDAEWQENDEPMRFASQAAAQKEIDALIASARKSGMKGYRASDYRVVPAASRNPAPKKFKRPKPLRFLVGKKLGAYTHACTTRQEALATAKATGAKVFVAELLQESDLEHLSMGRRVQNPHCNPAEPADEHAETELELWVANDAKFHRMALACAAVVEKHRAKGRFDASKAPLAYSKLVDTAAKSYAREFDDASRWNQLFSAATRRNVCASLADIFATRYREGVR